MSAMRRRLPDGRWHYQHGPIDVVIGAEGEPSAVAAAHEASWTRFEALLPELVGELGHLREPLEPGDAPCRLHGAVARRMWMACAPYRAGFITPMAAVAGAVAEELAGDYARDGIERAWVNNGGDIALQLQPGTSVKVGLYANLARFDAMAAAKSVDAARFGALETDGQFEITASMPVRGIATSGWRGRSFSLGIADSVTVLAGTASQADAAATIVGNAVDVEHPSITRRPASEVKDDSDLGSTLVTVDVPPLAPILVERAMAEGKRKAEALLNDELIAGAVLVCQGRVEVVGSVLA